MAIVFEKKRKPVNWIAIGVVLFSFAFLVFAIYFLFFASEPRIDLILPPELEQVNKISNIEFQDPASIISSPAFKNLRQYIGAPSAGTLNRQNPFQPI